MRYKREPLTGEEAQRLIAKATTRRERLVILLLLDTGIRLAELTQLTRDNIDWQSHRLIVQGKGRKRRVVPTTARSWELVERHYADADTLGVDARTVQRLVRAVARSARISRRCSPHVLRHTFAVQALQRGVSIAAVSRLLGHEDLSTTAGYLNLSNEEALREFAAKS